MTSATPAAARFGYHVMVKPTGPVCNLDCRYCFYLDKNRFYPDASTWTIDEAVLDTFVRDYITSQDSSVVRFAWQGGEPTLLGLEFFRRVVEIQAKYADGREIENGLQTNGVLIDEAWCEFLARERFLIGLSLDGPRELHDLYRVDRGGHPTFDRVMRAAALMKAGGVEFNTLTVLHRENARHPLEVYRFLREHGSGFQQFIPIVERVAMGDDGARVAGPRPEDGGRVSSWAVDPADFGTFLCTVFDEWVRRDVGRVFVQLFDVALEAWALGGASLCVFQPTCGRALALEHNGDLYSCDHFVFPAYRLGNIANAPIAALVDSPQQVAFGQAKLDTLTAYCRDCEVRFACHGDCPKHRFASAPNGEPGLSYLCPGYKRFFAHVDPYMRFMAEELRHERPPANVMRWTGERDRRAAMAAAGRNDPCPCGSGRKFKKCCGVDREQPDGRDAQ